MSKIIESIVRLYDDVVSQVSKEAISVSKEIILQTTCLDKVLKKLAPYIRKIFERVLLPDDVKNISLAFGVVPQEIIAQLGSDEN